jgi:hypothetical protein
MKRCPRIEAQLLPLALHYLFGLYHRPPGILLRNSLTRFQSPAASMFGHEVLQAI